MPVFTIESDSVVKKTDQYSKKITANSEPLSSISKSPVTVDASSFEYYDDDCEDDDDDYYDEDEDLYY